MKTKLIQIGNSKGIRIPKPLIEQSGLSDEIEMILRDQEIVLRSPQKVREGWEDAFQKMAELEDDKLPEEVITEKPSEWDETDWTWE